MHHTLNDASSASENSDGFVSFAVKKGIGGGSKACTSPKLAGSAFTEMLGIDHEFNDTSSVAEDPDGLVSSAIKTDFGRDSRL
jgi:hypothetical protein